MTRLPPGQSFIEVMIASSWPSSFLLHDNMVLDLICLWLLHFEAFKLVIDVKEGCANEIKNCDLKIVVSTWGQLLYTGLHRIFFILNSKASGILTSYSGSVLLKASRVRRNKRALTNKYHNHNLARIRIFELLIHGIIAQWVNEKLPLEPPLLFTCMEWGVITR